MNNLSLSSWGRDVFALMRIRIGSNEMKLTMLLMLLLTPLILSIGQVGQETRVSFSPPTVHVKGRGCLRPGNVAGCVVLHDYKARRKYNVFFVGDKPDINTGISFEGLGYSHLDPHCKQGQKVQVTEWKPLKGECPQR